MTTKIEQKWVSAWCLSVMYALNGDIYRMEIDFHLRKPQLFNEIGKKKEEKVEPLWKQ